MRTMAEMATGLAAAISGCRVRMALILVGIFVGAATAHAQDVNVEFAEGSLAPAAEEMAAAGVDGSLESAATLIEIAQRHGFGYGISPDEVRDLLGIGYQAIRQIDCSSLDARAAAAQRLSRALSAIAWLYAAGAGLTVSVAAGRRGAGFRRTGHGDPLDRRRMARGRLPRAAFTGEVFEGWGCRMVSSSRTSNPGSSGSHSLAVFMATLIWSITVCLMPWMMPAAPGVSLAAAASRVGDLLEHRRADARLCVAGALQHEPRLRRSDGVAAGRHRVFSDAPLIAGSPQT